MVTTTGPSVIPSTRPGRGGGAEHRLWMVPPPLPGRTASLIQPRWLPPPANLPKASGLFLSEQPFGLTPELQEQASREFSPPAPLKSLCLRLAERRLP